MNITSQIPCIDVQDEAILIAANAMHPKGNQNVGSHAHVSDCIHLGDSDPQMERIYRANGSLAQVTFFDSGNGWSGIIKAEAKNQEDGQEFADRLWQEILFNADNREQNREMLQETANHCPSSNENCHCARKLAALK